MQDEADISQYEQQSLVDLPQLQAQETSQSWYQRTCDYLQACNQARFEMDFDWLLAARHYFYEVQNGLLDPASKDDRNADIIPFSPKSVVISQDIVFNDIIRFDEAVACASLDDEIPLPQGKFYDNDNLYEAEIIKLANDSLLEMRVASTEEELSCNYWLMLPDIPFPFPLKHDEECGKASCLLPDIRPVRAGLGRFQVGVIYH